MKVVFDHQIFSYQRYGGISKYFSELIGQFVVNKDIDVEIGILNNTNSYLSALNLRELYNFNNVETNNLLKKCFNYIKNKRLCIEKFKNPTYDVLHSTFYDPYTLKHNKKPHVITVHDMTPELYPEYFNGTIYSYLITRRWILGKKQLIEKADKIISVSQQTKEDLIKIYKVPENKVEVIHHGYNILPEPSAKLISDPYILYLGLRDKYKNFAVFVKGISSILKKEKIKVLCVGGGSFTNNEKRLLKECQVEEYFIQKTVNDSGLASAYRNALCFVYPSEYEGFGMPILEAFYCDCPVILTNSSCFPEIAGDAALYFDSQNIKQLRNCLNQFLNNSGLRTVLINKGHDRLKCFSWEKTAKYTIDIYRNL